MELNAHHFQKQTVLSFRKFNLDVKLVWVELIGNQSSNWYSLYLCSMSQISYYTLKEGMVVMGRRPMTTAALSARLCSIQER